MTTADETLETRERLDSRTLLTELGKSILTGELPPGSKLTEAELAQRYGVSRGVLREALARLEERRLIERKPYSGTRVSLPSKESLLELYQMRSVLEGLAARLAANQATGEQIAELREIAKEGLLRLDQIGEAARSANSVQLRDGREALLFHVRLVEISGSAELLGFLNRNIWDFSLVVLAGTRMKRTKERLLQGNKEHEDIVRAIESRDGELADILMRRHVMNSFYGFQFV